MSSAREGLDADDDVDAEDGVRKRWADFADRSLDDPGVSALMLALFAPLRDELRAEVVGWLEDAETTEVSILRRFAIGRGIVEITVEQMCQGIV